MTVPRPQEWTKAEVHRLKMLAKRKISAGQYRKIAWPLRRVSENKSTRIASDPFQEGEEEMIGQPTEAALLTWAFFFFR